MALRLPLIIAGGAVCVGAMACAGGGADEGIVAIAVNQDAEARPRLAFYAGVPERDGFFLPAGNYDLIVMDMAGGIATLPRAIQGGEDVAAGVLAALDLPSPPEAVRRLNREGMRNLFLFFARFDEAQAQLEELLTEGHTRPAPASPDDLTAIQILGQEREQGRLLGIRDWETELGSWGRALELGLRVVGAELRVVRAELPPGSLDSRSGPFANVEALVREWRDGAAVDRRVFLEVVGRLNAERRVDLYEEIVAVFEDAASDSVADFYRRVELGELDGEIWAIANFAYENDQPGPAARALSYGEIARAEGLEPGHPYYDRWLRQSPSVWGFLWSVSVETAERARLPAEVFEVAQQRAATAPAIGEGLQVESP